MQMFGTFFWAIQYIRLQTYQTPLKTCSVFMANTGCAKKWPNLSLSKLRQISTKFDNFWHTDSQDDRNV